jgi:glycosyltransferase involved in cell wall biosynthesis
MNICMIGCWYRDDIYGHHWYHLMNELALNRDVKIKVVTSNCSCFSSSQRYAISKNDLITESCDTVKIPYIPLDPSKKYGNFKYYFLRLFKIYYISEIVRGCLFFKKASGFDIIHFDQALKSFGSLPFITLVILAKLFNKKVVVTMHELDTIQEKYKRINHLYNKADKIIVFSEDFREELVGLGINEDRIKLIRYGVSVEKLDTHKRNQFIYYGGHNLLKGKGFDTLVEAVNILKLKGHECKILIYSGNASGINEGKILVKDMGLEKFFIWSPFLYGTKLSEAYQKSMACIIPFTGGSGRYPATTAMANATPVIATRKASLPEYLNELGIYINENSPKELADAILYLMDNPHVIERIGGKLRSRAKDFYSKDVIGNQFFELYQNI